MFLRTFKTKRIFKKIYDLVWSFGALLTLLSFAVALGWLITGAVKLIGVLLS